MLNRPHPIARGGTVVLLERDNSYIRRMNHAMMDMPEETQWFLRTPETVDHEKIRHASVTIVCGDFVLMVKRERQDGEFVL